MDDDPARGRFFMLSLVRLTGVGLALLGIALIAKRWIEPAELTGGILVVTGAIDVLVVPLILARRWRSPDR